ncbi:MAG: hypothetical protein Q7T33_15360 [Dehalococcoidia bacterium]|nr:hypothetical protein [Dehalococcoidia bacterium]
MKSISGTMATSEGHPREQTECGAMDLSVLKPGDRLRTVDGALIEVIRESEDGHWILVRYLLDTNDPSLIGTEDLCHEDELAEPDRLDAASR